MLRERFTLQARSATPVLRFPHPRCSPHCQGKPKSWAPVSWSLQKRSCLRFADSSIPLPTTFLHALNHSPTAMQNPPTPDFGLNTFLLFCYSTVQTPISSPNLGPPQPLPAPATPPTLLLLTSLIGIPPNLCAHPGSTSPFPGMPARGGTPGRKGGCQQESLKASRRRLAACSQPPSGTRALYRRE